MKKFEYLSKISSFIDDEKITKLGENGWELINFIYNQQSGYYDFVFKREIIEQRDLMNDYSFVHKT